MPKAALRLGAFFYMLGLPAARIVEGVHTGDARPEPEPPQTEFGYGAQRSGFDISAVADCNADNQCNAVGKA